MARTSSLLLLVNLLLMSQLVLFIVAVPSTRLQPFQQEKDLLPDLSGDANQVNTEESMLEGIINGRMDFEINDYPESGANNRHNPKPPSRN